METIKTNNPALDESAKVFTKIFNDSNAALMEIYKKQMETSTNFYNNLFSAFSNNGLNRNFTNPFSNFDATKWFTNPFANYFSSNFSNPFFSPIEKSMNQAVEFNRNLFSTFIGDSQNNKFDWESISEEYKETINARMEAFKKTMNTISETFNKQLEATLQFDKKAIEEISNQFDSAMKQNQKFWNDLLKNQQTSLPLSDGEKNKTASPVETKKRSNVPVNELHDANS